MNQPYQNTLTIVSWNMLDRNKKLDEAFAFIESLAFDVLCLQEVPPEFLERLRDEFPHLAVATDRLHAVHEKHPEYGIRKEHLVIVSRAPISRSVSYPAVAAQTRRGRSEVFQQLMHRVAGWSTGPEYGREVLEAEIVIGSNTMRVINAHLLLEHAATRSREFAAIADRLTNGAPTIICGDFNILESFFIKPLNYLRGGAFHTSMPWYSERDAIEKQFTEAGLANPLRAIVTHGTSQSQLDHILVPRNAEVLSRSVIKDTYGSDHHPVSLQVRM